MRMRRRLTKRLVSLFPEHVSVTTSPISTRSILKIDHSFSVSIIVCTSHQVGNRRRSWTIGPTVAERENITLICKLNPARNRIQSYHLVPKISFKGRSHRSTGDDVFLRTGVVLTKLSKFYSVLKAMKARIASDIAPQLYRQDSLPQVL